MPVIYKSVPEACKVAAALDDKLCMCVVFQGNIHSADPWVWAVQRLVRDCAVCVQGFVSGEDTLLLPGEISLLIFVLRNEISPIVH